MDKFLNMSPQLYDYIRTNSVREASVLRRLREETASNPKANMQISADQGQFLALLVKLMGARRTLEIGVFTGYSSLSVALALPPEGRIAACDVSEEWTSVARRYWKEAGVEHKIDLHLAPAVETLDRLLAEGQSNSFDFAFIDADKGNYENYFERALQLVRKGGLIVVDNTLWSGRVADPAEQEEDTVAIRRFNKKLAGDSRIDLSMLPVADGITLALKL
jgi:predicted O-methyltransferase YrrM